MNNIFNLITIFFKQRLLIRNLPAYIAKLKERIRFNKDSIINNGNCSVNSLDTKFFKIIIPEYLNAKEIERLKAIENSPLVQSLRKEKILLMKSYSNEFSFALEEL